jgi:N-sulfoglucosamine sulfohydrolase
MKKAIALASFTLALCGGAAATKPNILLITADDMNHDSAGCYGCPIRDLTPHLDALASEGLRFQYAYSTVAVCQPVRETMHSGLYPHRSGAMGFLPLKPEVRTLNQQLHDAGYLISMIGKNPHYQPAEKFCVDLEETSISRSPAQLAAVTKKFVSMAGQQQRPFFHHVNCTDPHRPFIGAGGANDLAHGDPPSRWVKPEEVKGVPGFLEDLPDIRRELAQYYTNVRRLDDCVGAVLGALKEAGAADSTLVVFYGGDHGMSFPFAKSNDYEDSSRGALLWRWPGVVKPGAVDRDHLVSTLDFTPTLLEAAGLPALPNIDGRSFLPALKGEKMAGWDRVYTFYNQTSGRNWYPMRCVRTKDRSYIWNAWSDGQTEYRAENMSGLTWKTMLAAAEGNPAIKQRTDFYLHRVPEEFYDMSGDRYERKNLISDPARQHEVEALRADLLALLRRTGDPLAEAFAQRDKPAVLKDAMAKLADEYERPPKAGKGKAKKAAAKVDVAPAGGGKKLISFGLPEACVATEPATVTIKHHFQDQDAEHAVTVTLLAEKKRERLERKVIRVKGEGEAAVTFALPAALSGQSILFAAFVGEDFKTTPCHIQSEALAVK